jgi:hypothetical protein
MFNQLSQRFKHFSKNECENSSRLYEYLSLKIADDKELLEICDYARIGQPIPNLLLGSVHYLLLIGKNHPLKEYYPSLVDNPKDISESFEYFKDFCKQFKLEIIHLLKTKIVQTNEVRRCAYLYPSFCYIHQKVNKPISLIEIGTSAGLQLLWDQYKYSFNSSECYGNPNSDLHIQSEIINSNSIPLLKKSPLVFERYGLDLHVNDLNNEENYRWLKALIWPEHFERRELFDKAAKCMKNNQIHLIEGDGVELLSDVSDRISKDSILCIFHTHVANQMPNEVKQKLLESVEGISQKRDVFHLYNNIGDRMLHLDYYLNGEIYQEVIGETDGHGKWFEWRL